MIREEILKYFSLERELHQSLINYINDIRINTAYDKVPFNIKIISNDGNGLLYVVVEYKMEDQHNYNVEVSYSIKMDDLGRY